jgi:magnesium and cobalt transporter
MQVSGMQARDIMVPRPQMAVIKAGASLEEILPQITSAASTRATRSSARAPMTSWASF